MNTPTLSPAEQIEYYLGKDRLPNLHWKPVIPKAWAITPRVSGMQLCNPDSHNKTVTIDSIDYYLNNLGYRSNFDYNITQLQNKKIILLLGDSDTFGKGSNFSTMYATKIQELTDYCVVNLGIPGISADGLTRVGVQSILSLNSAIHHVCVLWPMFSMREFVSKTFKSGVHSVSDNIPYTDWWDHIDWVSNNYNYQKNKILLEQTTLNAGAMYHELMINRNDPNTVMQYTKNGIFTELTNTSHEAIANYFVRKINNQPSLYKQLNTQS
jgi:hypothetical protein